jgi:hypothetical protein
MNGVYVKTAIGLIMMLLSAAAHGQLYKCIGKDGSIEYANACPPGTRQEAMGIRSAPSSPTPAEAPKSAVERDAEFRKRMVEKQEAQAKEAKQLAEAEQRRRACDDARSYLKSLQEGLRVVKVDPKTGERMFLDDAQYSTEIAAAQRSVESNCR